MPVEVCQAQRVLNAQPLPCDTCKKRPSCLAFTAWRLRFEAPDPLHFKKHLISSCSGYAPQSAAAPVGADIRPSLAGAGVRHLCRTCPESEKGACRTHHDLEEIRRTADAAGLKLSFTVYACKTRNALLQIGDR